MRCHDIFVWTRTTDIPYFNSASELKWGISVVSVQTKMILHRVMEPFSPTYVYI